MTLALAAPLLLLDEPTSHLDIGHAVETMTLLKSLVEMQGKTVILVLHDINLMTAFAEDVVLMGDGQIVFAVPFETRSRNALFPLFMGESVSSANRRDVCIFLSRYLSATGSRVGRNGNTAVKLSSIYWFL